MADGYTYAGESSKGSFYSTVYDAEDSSNAPEDDLTTLKLGSKLAATNISSVVPEEFKFGASKTNIVPKTQLAAPEPSTGGYTYHSEAPDASTPEVSNTGYSYHQSEPPAQEQTSNKASAAAPVPSEFTFGGAKASLKTENPVQTTSVPNPAGYSYSGAATPESGYSYASATTTTTAKSEPPPAEFTFGASKAAKAQGAPYVQANSYSYASNGDAGAQSGNSYESNRVSETSKPTTAVSEFTFGASKTAAKAQHSSTMPANGGYSYGSNPAAPAPTPAATKNPQFSSASEGYSYSDKDSKAQASQTQPASAAGASAAAADQSTQRDWTQEMYSHLSDVQKRSLRTSGNLIENANKYVERGTTVNSLIDVATSFTSMATQHGTTIIEEKFKAADARTIKSQNVGGVAGGEKYIHDGIFFKFAVDDHGLYGDLERAMKTAGHEMKGLTALIDWELKTVGLHTVKFPLMILIDYRGSRLAATSSLPINSKTLVVGSGDSGKSINGPSSGPGAGRPSTERLFQLFKEWGKFLNLREHEMLTAKKTKELVPIAFDVEGHVGKDGNLWCVDFARVFPPSAFVPKLRGGFLFQLLRPEFVKAYPRPLCADAYLRALTDRSMDADINEATKYLKTDFMVSCAKIFDQMPALPTRVLALLVHQYGINYRYMRYLSASLKREELKKQINSEIVCRVVKNLMRREFRQLKSTEPTPYLRTIARVLTLVFSNLPMSAHFWEVDLPLELDYRYECPTEELFGALERSMRQDAASILAPLGPEAQGGAKGKKRGLKNSQSSSSGYATASGRSTDPDYEVEQAPQPLQSGLKKTTSGRLVKQVSYVDPHQYVDEEPREPRERHGYAAALSTAPASRGGRTKGRRRPSETVPYGYNAEPTHSYAESSEAALAEVQIKKDVAALKQKLAIKRQDVNLTELFTRLVSMMCIDLAPSASARFQQMLDGDTGACFDEADVVAYRPTIKTMFLTSFQQAYRKKQEADKTDDFAAREQLLTEASEIYMECLERNTRNSFALHNFARVLQALAPFKSANPDEEKQLIFISKRMASLAEQENKAVKRADIDLYQYSELFDDDGKPRKIVPAKTWLRPEIISRLILLRQELQDSLQALQEAQDAADEEMVLEVLQMLKESYQAIFDEIIDEADEQGCLINSVPRRAALYCWKLYVEMFPQNAAAWDGIIEEIYSEGRIYITREQWTSLTDMLYGI